MAVEARATNRVLVVDDERDIRTMLDIVLESQALPHVAVSNGQEALDRLRDEEYGSVLLDLMMPIVDGFTVLREIRKRRPDLIHRIIVLTGGSTDLVNRVDKDVFCILRKPVPMRVLLEKVRSCLEQEVPPSGNPDGAAAA